MYKPEMFEKSIIVSAHPDDEVLWFSSILDKVDTVLICYLAINSEPQITISRQKSLSEHPCKNIHCLGIDESEAFFDTDWQTPSITKYGMKIFNKRISAERYKKNYYALKQHLENQLAGYHNVFTHNPWGEYGHVEHVQVYRVIKELQEKMKFHIWFSNYCSNKSTNLMVTYSSAMGSEYTTLKINQVMANAIKELYLQNGCWTWYSGWRWSIDESFIKDEYDQNEFLNQEKKTLKNTHSQEAAQGGNHVFPINFIKIKMVSALPAKQGLLSMIIKKTLGLLIT